MSIFVQSHGFINSKLGSVLLSATLQLILNSDFDAYHDSPKGEVIQNVLVKLSDVSDIFNDIFDDKEDSSCLKSLWKTTLCRFSISI